MKFLTILIGIITLSACASVSTNHRPSSYNQEYNSAPSFSASLFGGNAEGFNEEAIQKILSYRLSLPAQSRVAILNLNQDASWRYYSNSFTHLDDEMIKGLITNLNQSPRVYDASFLPALVIPQKKSLTTLRIAAARYQADLLLTYRTYCELFKKYKFIDPDIIKAYCTVEAIALDIRSGIVSFTAISTNEFTTEKKDEDINFFETHKKAEMKAINAGLAEVSLTLRDFIEKTPTH